MISPLTFDVPSRVVRPIRRERHQKRTKYKTHEALFLLVYANVVGFVSKNEIKHFKTLAYIRDGWKIVTLLC